MRLDLRDVPVYWLSGRPARRQHMLDQLRGFRHEPVDGTPSPLLGANPSLRLLTPLGRAKVIEHAVNRMPRGQFKPFVLLEDDVAWRAGVPHGRVDLSFPDVADAIYLGISECAVHADVNDYCYDILRERSSSHPHLQRIYNMLSPHAVLFLSLRHTLAHAQAMIESCVTGAGCDTLSSRQFAKHEVFALGVPLFYQYAAVGGNEPPTNITWTNDTHNGPIDRFAARTYNRVHPYSTLLTPLEQSTTVAVWIDTDADIDTIRATPDKPVACWWPPTFSQARYERVLCELPLTRMLWPKVRDLHRLLADLRRVNPHDSYTFHVQMGGFVYESDLDNTYVRAMK